MSIRTGREIGGPFTRAERDLLELACTGSGNALAQARRQLDHAVWGGYEHDDCECFLVTVRRDVGLDPLGHDGGPFSVIEVSKNDECLGHLNLWVVDGYLHSLDYAAFDSDDHAPLTHPDQFALTRLD